MAPSEIFNVIKIFRPGSSFFIGNQILEINKRDGSAAYLNNFSPGKGWAKT